MLEKITRSRPQVDIIDQITVIYLPTQHFLTQKRLICTSVLASQVCRKLLIRISTIKCNKSLLFSIISTKNKKNYWFLQNEHVAKLNEIFSQANRVTRRDKALILGFMGGCRENPMPSPENYILIKLGETEVGAIKIKTQSSL